VSKVRSKFALWLCCCAVLFAGPAGILATGEAPATQSQPSSAQAQAGAGLQPLHLLQVSIHQAAKGDFADARAAIGRAIELAPENVDVQTARRLLEQYARRLDEAQEDRETEYKEAVRRVRWRMVAQETYPQRESTQRQKELEAKAEQIVAACENAVASDVLRDATTNETKDLRRDALEGLRKGGETLDAAAELAAGDESAFAGVFREVSDILERQIRRCRKTWETMTLDTPGGRVEASEALEPAERELAEALTDLEAILGAEPWKSALVYADAARELAVNKDRVADQEWFQQLVDDVRRRGREAVEQAKWYDALSAYAGLAKLFPDNERYEQELDKVRRHVRMLELYTSAEDDDESPGGAEGEDQAAPETRPSGPAAQVQPRWEKLVSGVDAEIVTRAIKRLRDIYVSPVDFRELTRQALLSVKIFASTPQLEGTFPGLRDEKAKQQFLAAIDRQLGAVEDANRVDDLDLHLAFNSVLRASERTINVPTSVLAVEFAEGFLDDLDRFSAMIWPEEVSNFRKHMLGQFVGVGIRITKSPGEPLKVVTPLAGSPAHKAGVRTGDMILAVDGRPTKDRDIDELVDSIMGEKGTKVVLTIKRPGRLKPVDIPIVRDTISIRTVKGWRRKPASGKWIFQLDVDPSIGYIRLTQFTDETASEIRRVLDDLKSQGVDSLILDLRLCPGGLLRSAVAVADEFLSSGRIVSTRRRQVLLNEKSADSGGEFVDGKVIVLVDNHSASASEIVAGALQDLGRALVVGERTYGKGSVQNVIPLRTDPLTREPLASLKITTAYYYVGESQYLLHRENGSKTWGVEPDVHVFMTPEQKQRYREEQFENELLQEDLSPEKLDEQLAREYDADLQLQTAVTLLRLMRLEPTSEALASAAPEDREPAAREAKAP